MTPETCHRHRESQVILIECLEIGTLIGNQVASLSGLAPMTSQSGKWRGKPFIQGGRKHLRDALTGR